MLDTASRTAKRHRAQIRGYLGFRIFSAKEERSLHSWLVTTAITSEVRRDRLGKEALVWCQEQRIEPPGLWRLDRIVGSALQECESTLFATICDQLTDEMKAALDQLLVASGNDERVPLSYLKGDPGRANLKTAAAEIDEFQTLRALGLPAAAFRSIPGKVLEHYRTRIESEPPSRTQERTELSRHALLGIYCWARQQEVIDHLVDLVIDTVHRLSVRAEKRIIKELVGEAIKVKGKATLLFRVAEASLKSPDETIRTVLFPLISEERLRYLVQEFRANGPAYEKKVHSYVLSSYQSYCRRMLPAILEELELRSNNLRHRPILEALAIVRTSRHSRGRYYSLEDVPVQGVLSKKLESIVVENSPRGEPRINRINYEVCLLQALRTGLRCKEIRNRILSERMLSAY